MKRNGTVRIIGNNDGSYLVMWVPMPGPGGALSSRPVQDDIQLEQVLGRLGINKEEVRKVPNALREAKPEQR